MLDDSACIIGSLFIELLIKTTQVLVFLIIASVSISRILFFKTGLFRNYGKIKRVSLRLSKRFFNKSKPKEENAYLNFVTGFKEEKFAIIWRIENLHRCTLKSGEFLETHSFSAGPSSEVKWTLRLYPKGRKTPENSGQRKDEDVGLFIKRISTDPVTSSFKCRFICERRLLLNGASKANITLFYPEEDLPNIMIDSTKSSEYGTDHLICSDLTIPQTLVVRCNIYVINAYNMGTSSNNILGFSKSESLLEDLKTVYDNGKFSDVTLQAGDVKFPAHKVILASRSQVFDAMFQHDMKESQTNIVHIENIEPAILSDMLQYMYTGSVNDFYVEKAISLYPVADKYFLEELKKWCLDIMLESLKVENVCQIVLLADLHPDPKLKEATFNMFRNCTSEIFKRKEWQDLVYDTDRRALVSDILQAVSADFTTNCADIKK